MTSYGSINHLLPPEDAGTVLHREENESFHRAVVIDSEDEQARSRPTRMKGATVSTPLIGALLVILVTIMLLYGARFPQQQNMHNSTLEALVMSSKNGRGKDDQTSYQVPFPMVDRADYNDPVSHFVQKDLFHPSLLDSNRHDFVFPFPTGAFWTNFVLDPTADRGLSYPVAVYPYAYKWSSSLLQVSYPSAHRKIEPTMIHDYFFPDMTLTSVEETKERHVVAFDPLSVTLRFNNNDSNGSHNEDISYWEAYLVQGSPYVTVRYQKTRPLLHALSIFTEVSCPELDISATRCTSVQTSNMSKEVTGHQFVIQSQEGMQWLVVSSKPITLVFDQITRTNVVSKQTFDGVLRIAHLPSDSTTATPSALGISQLIQYAASYPIGGQVDWSFRSGTTTTSPRIGKIQFKFTTESFGTSTLPALLMLALPHHADSLPSNMLLNDFDLVYKCIKGHMTAVLGSTWAYDEVLPSLGFDDLGSKSLEALAHPQVQSTIIKSLKEDSILALPTLTENVYGFGKQSARLAQLCHIAKMLLLHTSQNNDKQNSTDLENLLAHLKDLLSSALEAFLRGHVRDYLVYDINLGGMVSNDGLSNTEADFGNGRYNDHHFHYGYLLYACAVMGNLDPTFVEQFRDLVDAVYFDIAFDGNADSKGSGAAFFPFTRHKVWFDGHSFASGMFPFGNGKSQESSSEAVNGYYGAFLWSLVRSGHGSNPEADTSSQTEFARLLLATEIRGAITYWHMSTGSSTHKDETETPIYPPQFAKNEMVGNLGMLDAICSTWFGTDPLYVHMINFIPVTSVTGYLFSKAFVSEEIDHALRPPQNVEMAWRGYVVADIAISDPNAAWKDAQSLFSPELDSGLSKSQVLYWVATRDDFDPSKFEIDAATDDHSSKSTTEDKSLCRENTACAKLELTGQCCPTSNGILLGCCSDGSSQAASSNGADDGESSTRNKEMCDQHSACAKVGLTGRCCPTTDGTMLGCCS